VIAKNGCLSYQRSESKHILAVCAGGDAKNSIKGKHMVTIFYAALLGPILVFLSAKVIQARVAKGAIYGDRGDMQLVRRCRAHANFTEYTPLFLILLFLAELHQLSHYAVHVFGAIFVLGRISHAYSLLKAEKIGEDGSLQGSIAFRQIGMMSSFIPITFLSVWLAWKSVVVHGIF
jgi:uncharacterized membrane protein YecN with MAPEG domain